ncbi:hypothetical protein ACFYT4_01325 [Streptomyces sp. NPDC004609]|uniref:hypothetical protein n=1 Tax=Streptomyces sp. NPDC004609 TaxID=3364704 RepID=UPI0036876747
MPKPIARLLRRALKWALPAYGRHRATPAFTTPASPVAWTKPWTAPAPAHVIERTLPLRGEDIPLVRPYALLDDTLQLRTVLPRRRLKVLVHAGEALDLPCGAPATGADL